MLVLEDKYLIVKKLTLGHYDTNAYILVCPSTRESLIIDAPANANAIIEELDGTTPRYILLTHDHNDHTGALKTLRERLAIPLATHEYNSFQLEKPPELFLMDNDVAELGELQIEVIFTPGHTPGGLCFRVNNYLFSGDTLFPGGPGHTDTPEDFKQIIESITKKIHRLPDDTVFLPGHGISATLKQSKEEYAVFISRPHNAHLSGDITWLNS